MTAKTELQKKATDASSLFNAFYAEKKQKAVPHSFTWTAPNGATLTVSGMVAPEALGAGALMNSNDIQALGMLCEQVWIEWDLVFQGEPVSPSMVDLIRINAPIEFVSEAVKSAFEVVAGNGQKSKV